MTKIKNTKKGMAKKTLSMSLVVAMLATSNVPVWAAEFSDGTDVTTFTSEADTPVVDSENTDDTVAAQAIVGSETPFVEIAANNSAVFAGDVLKVNSNRTNENVNPNGNYENQDYVGYAWSYIKDNGDLERLSGNNQSNDNKPVINDTFSVPSDANLIGKKIVCEMWSHTQANGWELLATSRPVQVVSISSIALKDQQWKDSVDGTLLERGKMPEYTYKNSNKESYKPVLAKVWIGDKEYTVGDQNVVAKHTYNTISQPGEYTVSVDLTVGGQTGTISQTYKVKAESFKETDVTWPTSLTYAPTKEFNEAATNATSVAGLTKYDGENAEKAQYKVEVESVVNGKTYVVVTGMNEYAGTSFRKEVTVAKYNLANAYVAPIEDQAYTGSDVEPAVTVKYNNEKGSELTRDTDYGVTYQKNRDAGTATVIITGKGNYEGTKTVTFNIVSKTFTSDITNAFDAALTAVTYNAKEQKPVDKDIETSGGLKLKYLSDFSTSYVNNVDAGTATVTIKGAGNYAGATYTRTFTINKANLSNIADKDITVADTTYSKDLVDELGKTIKPSVTVKFNGTTVREGVDYDITYSEGARTAGSRTIQCC